SAQMQRSLGTKPFPSQLGNGFPIFVMPVANKFRFHGDNVLDASALYANAPASQVPAFGLTMYGGGGDDLLIGSRARDFLFGGGGVDGDVIQGQNALNGDLVDYDSGTNVHIITRALSFPTWNQSVHPNADLLSEQRSRIRQVFDVPWQLAAYINGSTDYTPPTAPGVTARPGTTPPTTPYVTLDPRDRSSQMPNTWVTNLDRPNFIVTPGVFTALPYYANGQLGLNAKIFLNGDQYTQEPLADGTYILTATLTDYWGMTSAMAVAPKLVVVDSGAPDSPFAGMSILAACEALELTCVASVVELQDLMTIFAPPSHTAPDGGSLGGLVTALAQITVPGGLITTGLPFADQLAPWLDPLAALVQNGSAPIIGPIQHEITAIGLVPWLQPVNLLTYLLEPIDQAWLSQTLRNDLVDLYEANLEGPLTNLGFVFTLVSIPPPPSLGALDLNELELTIDELPLPELIPSILDESQLSFLDFLDDLGLFFFEPLSAAPPSLTIPGLGSFPGGTLADLTEAVGGGLLPLGFLIDQLTALDGTLDPIELAITELFVQGGLPLLVELLNLTGSLLEILAIPLGDLQEQARALLRDTLDQTLSQLAILLDPGEAALMDLAVQVAAALVPLVADLSGALAPVVEDTAATLAPVLAQLTAAIFSLPLNPAEPIAGQLSAVVDDLVVYAGELLGQTVPPTPPTTPLPPPLIPLAPITGLLGTTTTTLTTTMETAVTPLTTASEAVTTPLSTALAPVEATAATTVATVTTTAATTTDTVTAVVPTVTAPVTAVLDTATTTATTTLDTVTAPLATIVPTVTAPVTTAVTTATEPVTAAVTAATAPVTTAVTTATAPVTAAVTTTTAAVTTAVAPVTTAVTTATAPVTAAVTTTATDVSTATAPVTTAVTTATAPVTAAVTTATAPVTAALTSLFTLKLF
ncbi:MAG: hypothetical protein WD225_11435, partial [Ilumatobacteraceae bacterium]